MIFWDATFCFSDDMNNVSHLHLQMMRRLYGQLRAAAEADVARSLPVPSSAPAMAAHAVKLDDELDEAAQVPALRFYNTSSLGNSDHVLMAAHAVKPERRA